MLFRSNGQFWCWRWCIGGEASCSCRGGDNSRSGRGRYANICSYSYRRARHSLRHAPIATNDRREVLFELFALCVRDGLGREKGEVVPCFVSLETELETNLRGTLFTAKERWTDVRTLDGRRAKDGETNRGNHCKERVRTGFFSCLGSIASECR